jgi:hypothetical protein
MRFSVCKYGTKEKAYEAVIEKLNELNEKYKYIQDEIKSSKDKKEKESVELKKEKIVNEKLPNYIFSIIHENKIRGYYVEGLLDNNNNPFPRKEFIDNTNKWNLDQAKKYIEILKYINENNVNIEFIDFDQIDINSIEKSFFEKYYLPKYFNVLRKKQIIQGFCINGYPNKKYKDGKFKKEFQTINNKTIDDVYLEGITFLKNLNLKK